jgi:methionine aminopeptidase
MAAIYRTAVRPGETLHYAIVRAMTEVARWGYSGYEIVCERCGHTLDEHETMHDCEIWRRNHV